MRSPVSKTQFAVLAGLVTLAGFAGGLVSSRVLGPAEARADDHAPTSTIWVGAGGLAFRGEGGRVLARLDGDQGGAVFSLFNASGEPAARLRASSFSGVLDLPAQAAPHAVGAASPAPPATAGWKWMGPKDMGF